MKRQVITMLVSIFLLAGINKVHSQEQMSASVRAAKLTDWMKTNLTLNEGQVKQVEAINLKYANKADELRDNASLTKNQKVDALKADNKAREDEFKKILTEDQFKTYQNKKGEVKKMAKEKAKMKKA